jgi:hypothetical protein
MPPLVIRPWRRGSSEHLARVRQPLVIRAPRAWSIEPKFRIGSKVRLSARSIPLPESGAELKKSSRKPTIGPALPELGLLPPWQAPGRNS